VLLLSIPSPHTGVLHAGPLAIRMYGLMLLLGIAGCIWLTGVRWVRRGGDWDLVFRVAVWGVGFGIVGARLYHDVTSWSEVKALDAWWAPLAVWKGGLGVWGGILFGCIAGAVVVHRSGNSVFRFMDAVAPGLLLAQGIGRIGNWWNQELFGKPTTLPWGLKIDTAHRPFQYFDRATYHPTFLYELIWDLVGVALLIYVGKRFRLRPPSLFALYVVWYTFGRFFEELLRIDPAHHVAGLRVNAWVSIIVFVAALAYFVRHQFWSGSGGDTGGREPRRREPPKGPAMAIPKGRRVR
jgi:prolipoprotein diacylglyceryl transferase